jgi:hypothetical protein
MPLDRVIKFFASLRLTIVLLALGMILIFAGTLAQEPLGLYAVQQRFFHSFFVDASAFGAALHKFADMIAQGFGSSLAPINSQQVLAAPRIPAFPGGYLIGGVLLLNLVTAHFMRFKFTWRKTGIWMVHAGLILLLVGQLATDMLSVESALHLREGETKNYSESQRSAELAVMDVTDPETDKVVAIPQGLIAHGGDISDSELPFTVRVKSFFPNSAVANRAADAIEPAAATQSIGARATVRELPRTTAMDESDAPSAVVEIVTPQGSQGTWLASVYIERPQVFTVNNRTYQLVLRPERHYQPFSIQLVNFTHDIYKGTDVPKNFASRILLQSPETGEKREVLIYMNNPLRYAGQTFYQASYDKDDHGSVFQVVRNPSWLTPYFSCILVAFGLIVQFMIHLVGFIKRSVAS